MVVLGLLMYVSLGLRSKNGRGCQGIPELGGSTRVAFWRNLGSFQRRYRWISGVGQLSRVRDYIRSPIPLQHNKRQATLAAAADLVLHQHLPAPLDAFLQLNPL